MLPPLLEIVALLAAAVFVVAAFQRVRVPSSLGYLLVGVVLGPHATGVVNDATSIALVAEFGIVFLLFTIGLNFSLPQIYALRNTVLMLGTGQVLLTTAVVGALAAAFGFGVAAAFAIGAVFAQSSTTIIARQLTEQDEHNTRHGRLGLAMSVFQDVTAVPFVVIIPVLGATAAGVATSLPVELGWAMAKALLAFALVYLAGRWLLRPLFHDVAARRSAELFTLTVLLVTLASASATQLLGLSLAFGAFLAGMMLGEIEFRHQIESSIRPFRDVLLGLFFISIGMLVDPQVVRAIWPTALAAAAVLLTVKALVVVVLVRRSGLDRATAWRVGILLAVGGEFGFALLSLALDARVIESQAAQVALTAVLFSMIAGPFLIRYNHRLADLLAGRPALAADPTMPLPPAAGLADHVIICGYGRIGQNVGHFLEEEKQPFIALDLDPTRVREAHAAGEPVYYGDAAEADILEAVGLERARLVVISHDDVGSALKVLSHVRRARPQLPVMVRTRDESRVEELLQAGATEVVPETLEAGMMIVSHALLLLGVPLSRVVNRIREERVERYRLMREFFRGADLLSGGDQEGARLHSVLLPAGCSAVDRSLGELELEKDRVLATALLRQGERRLEPPADTRLQDEDVLVLFGEPDALARVEQRLLARG